MRELRSRLEMKALYQVVILQLPEQCVSPGDLNTLGTALQKLLSWVY